MGYEINWTAPAGSPVLNNPFYQKYSVQTVAAINLPEVQGDVNAALASRESAEVINYLSWVIRLKQLVA